MLIDPRFWRGGRLLEPRRHDRTYRGARLADGTTTVSEIARDADDLPESSLSAHTPQHRKLRLLEWIRGRGRP